MTEQARRIDGKVDAMYEDRLEGRITPDMYDRKASDLRAQANNLGQKIDGIRSAEPVPVPEAVDLMDLTSRAADLFLCSACWGETGISATGPEIGQKG